MRRFSIKQLMLVIAAVAVLLVTVKGVTVSIMRSESPVYLQVHLRENRWSLSGLGVSTFGPRWTAGLYFEHGATLWHVGWLWDENGIRLGSDYL
jgi:hypothetical protein